MPIYEYRCSSCGHKLETLQKISEPLLTQCPACHRDALVKQVSAAGFQLKGSGWYATDFRNGSKPPAKPDAKPDAKAEAKAEAKTETKGDAKTDAPASTESKAGTSSASASPASTGGANDAAS